MDVPMMALQMKLGKEHLIQARVEGSRKDRMNQLSTNLNPDDPIAAKMKQHNIIIDVRMEGLLQRYFGIDSAFVRKILDEPGKMLHHDALI